MILYNKLYYIDKYGHKKIRKQMRPIFQSAKQSLPGIKKNEIIRVAQENLRMLKRLNEKTSFYNFEKMKQDYEISQYYKKNHCLHPPIDFNKTQKSISNFGSTRKKFFSKNHYSSMNNLDSKYNFGKISLKKKKKFEEFNYRDLDLDVKNYSNIENKDDYSKEKEFKKISEIEKIEEERKREKKEKEEEKEKKVDVDEKKEKKINEDLEKEAGNNENINVGEINNGGKNKEKIEKENEKEKSFVENKEDGNEEIIMPKKNLRDDKEEKRKEKEENAG